IYIFGGADADYFYNDIWCFDTRALTWTPIPASGYLPTGRHGHACAIVEGVLYVFGGSSPDGSELNDAYAFRIHERRWYLFQNVGPAPSPRSGHTMCTVKDKIFVIGGESEQSNMEDPAYIYYLEIPKIRFHDSQPIVVPPRQVSSAKLVPNRPNDGMTQQQQQQQQIQEESGGASGPYIPPPPGANNAASAAAAAGSSPLLPPPGIRGLPPPPNTPSPPVSAQITLPPGAEKKTGAMPPPPPTALPPTTSNRSPSPAPARAYARGTPTPPPASASLESGAMSPTDVARVKQLESQAESARDANERLLQQMRDRDDELARMRRRENWLVAEVILARQNDLEKDLENQQLQGHQLMITRALVKVKEDLRHAKMSIATQAQTASFKIKEAERVRTGALQEAAYLKAKLSALSNAHQDPDTLAKVEMERAADLEKRLTLTLTELETVESQYAKTQESLQQEKMTRHAAEERSNGSTILAEQAQAAHTRALAELASLHSRAAAAEAESRDTVSKVSELEHELSSLKSLHKSSQAAASKSAASLAEAMIELSQLEQSSMKARAESLTLQKMLADEREGSALLRYELTKVEQDLETKIKELENNEVQLGLLKDVMRE
ncbi:MAG: hypothetical protein J3R72DRAFT_360295, partial [Linnemannia gamsii]